MPFSPSDIAGLALWYEADTGAYTDALPGTVPAADNDPVQVLQDQSGNDLHLSQATVANRPTFRAGILNGKPVLHYDGTDLLNRTSIPGGLFGSPDEVYILAVLRQEAADFDNTLLFWSDGVSVLRIYATYADRVYFDFGAIGDLANARSDAAQPAGWDGAWHLVECWRSPAAGTPANDQVIRADVVELLAVTRTGTLTAGSGELVLGAESGATQMTGDIAALLVYTTLPAEAERDQLLSYYNTKYDLGLPVGPPIGPDQTVTPPPISSDAAQAPPVLLGGGGPPQVIQPDVIATQASGLRSGEQFPSEGPSVVIDMLECTADLSYLSARQRRIYNHRIKVWRFSQEVDAQKGLTPRAWETVADCLPCRFERALSVKSPVEWALVESDNMFTYEQLHFHISEDIRAGDLVRIRIGPDAGDYFEVEGDDTPRDLLAHKKSVRLARTERRPTGVV